MNIKLVSTVKLQAATLLFALSSMLVLTACDDDADNWKALNNLIQPVNGAKVTLHIPSTVVIGRNVSLEVTSSMPGKVWVVAVDRNNAVTVLFPNNIDQDNEIAANHAMVIPSAGAKWVIQAAAPLGKTLYGVFVTTGNTNLIDILHGAEHGGISKAFHVAQVPDSWGLARDEVTVMAPLAN